MLKKTFVFVRQCKPPRHACSKFAYSTGRVIVAFLWFFNSFSSYDRDIIDVPKLTVWNQNNNNNSLKKTRFYTDVFEKQNNHKRVLISAFDLHPISAVLTSSNTVHCFTFLPLLHRN